MDWIKENTENTESETELTVEPGDADFLRDPEKLLDYPEPEKTEIPFTKAPPRPEIVVTAPWPQEILSPEEEEAVEEEEEEPEYHGSGARRLLIGTVAVLAIAAVIVLLLYGILFDGFSENLNFASLLSCFEVLKY